MVNLFRTTGIAESTIYEKIERELRGFPEYEVAFLPRVTGVDLRVIRGGDAVNDGLKFEKFRKMIYNHFADFLYTEKNIELEEVLGLMLKKNKETIAVAESLTGGLIQSRITNIPGSSAYYLGGVVTYSNESKINFLNVSSETLKTHGAVSAQAAAEMALGVQKSFQSDLTIATTGIAGPTGATPQKPLGLVYVGVVYHSQLVTRKYQFGQDREINKQRSAQAALELARRIMADIPV
jgi:nicotinamide-nucleotide amidase